jgi:hypothetical protein
MAMAQTETGRIARKAGVTSLAAEVSGLSGSLTVCGPCNLRARLMPPTPRAPLSNENERRTCPGRPPQWESGPLSETIGQIDVLAASLSERIDFMLSFLQARGHLPVAGHFTCPAPTLTCSAVRWW